MPDSIVGSRHYAAAAMLTLAGVLPVFCAQDGRLDVDPIRTEDMIRIDSILEKTCGGLCGDGYSARELGEIRESVCSSLREVDPNRRNDLLRFLQSREKWIDYSKMDGCFGTSNDDPHLSYGWLLDKSQLLNSSREEKLRILRDCIDNGSTELWRGTRMDDLSCIGMATTEGLDELRGAVESRYRDLSDWERSVLPWEVIEVNFELFSGGEDEEPAESTAIAKLAEMPSQSIAERMRASQTFQRVLVSLAVNVCEEKWDPRCRELWGILHQVREAEAAEPQNGGGLEDEVAGFPCLSSGLRDKLRAAFEGHRFVE